MPSKRNGTLQSDSEKKETETDKQWTDTQKGKWIQCGACSAKNKPW